eukprot:CAMPEP_0168461036 /NCGR_PEP_ID=MMETSP0228-20121227/53763_1 /TAXON_ID=133427 /ORGANISM="Protoceratium reticulatum, Strain CCCM 535 (=CCMP 1889)" /LENGTH=82 /DNA_ID=CAMNT_0008476309 /DNA_START=38 /DNA_END=283 /DNA_ORIENTATION=+
MFCVDLCQQTPGGPSHAALGIPRTLDPALAPARHQRPGLLGRPEQEGAQRAARQQADVDEAEAEAREHGQQEPELPDRPPPL